VENVAEWRPSTSDKSDCPRSSGIGIELIGSRYLVPESFNNNNPQQQEFFDVERLHRVLCGEEEEP
jgi:hypothetical protein